MFPEYHHGWGGKTCYRQLRIDPLPVAGAEELLRALIGDDASIAPLKRLLIESDETIAACAAIPERAATRARSTA